MNCQRDLNSASVTEISAIPNVAQNLYNFGVGLHQFFFCCRNLSWSIGFQSNTFSECGPQAVDHDTRVALVDCALPGGLSVL